MGTILFSKNENCWLAYPPPESNSYQANLLGVCSCLYSFLLALLSDSKRIALGSVFCTGIALAAGDCGALVKLTLDHASVTSALEMKDAASVGTVTNLPAFCQVRIISKPSSDSEIQIEVWLPQSRWNGKFLGVGNGGFAGSINYESLAEGLRHGYAAASTDTGHEAGMVDAKWALDHPEKTVDFGYRAIHEMTLDAKAVVRAFYGTPAKWTYFNGCSNGGRQALMEAQRFPSDYNGIIAGAPANYWTHLLANSAINAEALLASPGTYISAKKLPAIQAASLAACDALDGVKDGVIDNPPKCHYDAKVLECNGPESDSCLTAPELTALHQLYQGSRYFPGYSPGSEADQGAWDLWITGPAPQRSLMFGFATNFFANMVFSNAAWDFRTFDAARDIKVTDEKLAATLNSTDADLSKFMAGGGKLLLYHGWNDPAISAPNTVNYYNSVVEKLGPGKVSQFVKLYMVPGMLHCSGGAGPSDLGQFSLGGDAQHNASAAMERWVETGVAPQSIVAAKRKLLGGEIIRTRPLCEYPMVAKYKGSGSTDDAANFSCTKQ